MDTPEPKPELTPEQIELKRAKNREKRKRYYAKNREKCIAIQVKSDRKNKVKAYARQKAWREKNREKYLKQASERAKARYLRDPEKHRASRRQYYQENRAIEAVRHKTYCGTIKGRATLIIGNIRNRAKQSGKPCDIDRQWIIERLEKGVCECTKIPFRLAEEGPFTPSVDRKDSSIGYLKSNCRLVVLIYNRAKHDFTDEDVAEFCEAVYKLRNIGS